MSDDILVIKPQKLRGNDGYKTFSIRIKEETVNKIDSISNQTGHSRNKLIGIFLEFATEHCKVEK